MTRRAQALPHLRQPAGRRPGYPVRRGTRSAPPGARRRACPYFAIRGGGLMSQSSATATVEQTSVQWRALCNRADLVANSGVVAWVDGAQVALFYLPDETNGEKTGSPGVRRGHRTAAPHT